MDALTFLDKAAKSKRQPVYALVGDEDFLKGRCREAIQSLVLGDADPAFALSVYAGEKLEISAVPGDKVEALVKEVYETPADVAKKTGILLTPK